MRTTLFVLAIALLIVKTGCKKSVGSDNEKPTVAVTESGMHSGPNTSHL